jgi:uncharacterized protein YkwD
MSGDSQVRPAAFSRRWWCALVVLSALFPVITTVSANDEPTVFRDTDSIPIHLDRDQLERDLFDRVNEYREAHGVEPIIWDEALALVCRSHSEAMLDKRKLAHTLDGVSLEDRLEEAQLSFVCVRENVGWLQGFNVDPVEWELSRWSRSKVHKRNLLDPCVTHGAVGIEFSVDGNFYVTWEARRPADDPGSSAFDEVAEERPERSTRDGNR